MIPAHMRREEIDEETLLEALREHGVGEISGVEMAVLEIDGSISVVPANGTATKLKKPLKSPIKKTPCKINVEG